MSDAPVLIALSPSSLREVPVEDSPFWIGQRADCALSVHHPGVLERHVALVEREDGFWLRPAPGAAVTVNGEVIGEARPLASGDRIGVAPGLEYRFQVGAPLSAPAPAIRLGEVAAPRPPAPPPTPRHLGKRRPRRLPLIPLGRVVGVVALVGLVFGAVWAIRQGSRAPEPIAAPLSEEDAEYFQELMGEASERMERATTLLELGASEAALAEFARAVNALETSHLGTNPWLQPRIRAVEAAVGQIYRAKRMDVPAGYREAQAELTMASLFNAEIDRSEFARRVDFVMDAFRTEYGKDFVVTGRNHDEHLALYGPDGALDIRTRDLAPEEVGFLIETFRTMGIRVKDFSDDQVLAEQVRRAMAAGLADRAGTGLHLHVDRFASRKDRYTVQ